VSYPGLSSAVYRPFQGALLCNPSRIPWRPAIGHRAFAAVLSMQASRERSAVYSACSILAVSLRTKNGDAYLKKGFAVVNVLICTDLY